MQIKFVFLFGLLFGSAVFFCYDLTKFYKTYKFYEGNGFDFTKDFGKPMYFGDLPDETTKMSNRDKLYCGFPVTLAFEALCFWCTAIVLHIELR